MPSKSAKGCEWSWGLSREQWLELRHQDVTSTEVSAIFGGSPYLSMFELYHQKIADEPTMIEENERMKWGKMLEPIIAEGVAKERSIQIKALEGCYARDPEARMGASFDYAILSEANPGKSEGILEIKNVDGLVFRNKWEDGDPPPHIEMQVQYQLEITGMRYALLAALVGGNHLHVVRIDRNTEMGSAMRTAVARFWEMVDAKNEPEPVYEQDAQRIIDMLVSVKEGLEVNLTTNLEATGLAQEYAEARDAEKEADQKKKVAKAKLLELLGPAQTAYLNGYKVKCKQVEPFEGIAAKPGELVGKRRGYRTFNLNETS